jgi:DNA-binding transcriptional LysR family regulator
MGPGMLRNETKLMESAIALAEELHYQRAARKMRISQPMLTKNIQDLESLLGGSLFVRDRKSVALSDAGRVYVQHARLSLLYGERAVQSARSVMQELDVPLYVGRSPYVDPFLVSTLLSIQLPLFPRLRIELVSRYSNDLIHELLAGALDLAIANRPPESSLLTQVQIGESPFYIAMSRRDRLTSASALQLEMLAERNWILFERKLHPSLYDSIMEAAQQCNVRPSNVQHVTAPEEAFPFVADGLAIAFLVKAGALLLARNGVTVRPLATPNLSLKTYLVSRADNESRVASELVRAYMRKMSDFDKQRQMKLPIPA